MHLIDVVSRLSLAYLSIYVSLISIFLSIRTYGRIPAWLWLCVCGEIDGHDSWDKLLRSSGTRVEGQGRSELRPVTQTEPNICLLPNNPPGAWDMGLQAMLHVPSQWLIWDYHTFPVRLYTARNTAHEVIRFEGQVPRWRTGSGICGRVACGIINTFTYACVGRTSLLCVSVSLFCLSEVRSVTLTWQVRSRSIYVCVSFCSCHKQMSNE